MARAQTDGPVRLLELAEPPPPAGPYDFSKGGALTAADVPARYLGNPYFLGFAGGLHRPPADERIDPALRALAASGTRTTYAYVMFRGPITAAARARVEALGVDLLHYHPNNSHAANVPLAALPALERLPEVRWVGYARSEQKIHPLLVRGITSGVLRDRIPIVVSLFESDLGPDSVRVPGPPAVHTVPGGGVDSGPPSAAAFTWRTNGDMHDVLVALGVEVGTYRDEIRAYEAEADAMTILELVGRDDIAFVEWRPPNVVQHDRVVPQLAADWIREQYPTNTVTVGVIDSGFHLANGGYNGHVDLNKDAVGWNYTSGGCGSVFCDEPSQGYHGTHVLGTVCGTGTANIAIRGIAPHLGANGATQRLFLVKGLTSNGFQHMRQPFTDGSGNTSPRPVAVNNSWGSDCPRIAGSCQTSGWFWIGSEAEARTVDAEVFNHDQLYVFAAGNHGGVNGSGGFEPGTVSQQAAAKNSLAVGMSRDSSGVSGGQSVEVGSIVYWSSHGPCGDGRFKPNLNAPGCSTESTLGGTQTGYATQCGTSMSAPTVTGIMAAVTERYGIEGSSALQRCWAMATSLPWRDERPAGTWGRLSSSHLNAYGMGRVSAPKALNGGGSLPWYRAWTSSTIGNSGRYFDFTVQPGTTRLLVVLTWNDTPAAPGANPAVVSDIDLWVDQAPFTSGVRSGEYSSRSSIETVEHVIINDPTPGSYRVKIDPYANSTNVPFGVMVVADLGPTKPGGTLSAQESRRYIRPGEAVDVTVAVDVDSYLASNVWLDQRDHAGFTIQGTTFPLYDGVTLIDRHDANGDVTIGDVMQGFPRAVTYHYREVDGSDAVRWTLHETRSDNWARRTVYTYVTVDGTPPGLAANLTSTSHVAGQWSNDPALDLTWTAAPDNLSGLDGYGAAVSTGAPASPPSSKTLGSAVTSQRVTMASSAAGYYFNLRAVDRSGNWGATASAGPFLCDLDPPPAPRSLGSPTHRPGVWSANVAAGATWTAVSDPLSGLSGYAVAWDQSRSTVPSTVNLPASATSHATTLQGSPNGWYFHLRPRDVAGNWGPTTTIGPFLVDATAPICALQIDGGSPTTTTLAVTLAIQASENESGLDAMRLKNDGGSFSPWMPITSTMSWNLDDHGGAQTKGTRTVLLEVRNDAGLVASASDTIYLYEPVSFFGTACAGSLGPPGLSATGAPGIGRTLTFTVTNSAAPSAQLWIGASDTTWTGFSLPLELGLIGLSGCYVNVSLDAQLGTKPPGTPFDVAIPANPSFAGQTVFFQAFAIGDPSGKLLVPTAGARASIGGL